jgi:hypothetical protein
MSGICLQYIPDRCWAQHLPAICFINIWLPYIVLNIWLPYILSTSGCHIIYQRMSGICSQYIPDRCWAQHLSAIYCINIWLPYIDLNICLVYSINIWQPYVELNIWLPYILSTSGCHIFYQHMAGTCLQYIPGRCWAQYMAAIYFENICLTKICGGHTLELFLPVSYM